MKTLLIILAITSMTACTKCVNCTRTWTTELYQDSAGVQINYYLRPIKEYEYFDVCGSSEIKNAEYPTTTITSQLGNDGTIYISRRTSTCNCTTN
mgnify:CR=1 FL=1